MYHPGHIPRDSTGTLRPLGTRSPNSEPADKMQKMTCPACGSAMRPLTLEGRQGAKVDIDLCADCRGFWFDQYESLRLAPGGTLKLFRLMAERGPTGRPLPQTMRCPRCLARLALTHDMQNSTRFQYWQCPQNQGRFITF